MTRYEFMAVTGGWLRRNRLTLGLSQEQVAQIAGASQAAVSMWEQGSAEIGAYAYQRLLAHFVAARGSAGAPPALVERWVERRKEVAEQLSEAR